MASDGITIATMFNYTRAQLRSLSNISYLYNPNWNPDGDARAGRNTLPMALLMVTGEQEIGQSQLSTQQMIMYKGEQGLVSELKNKEGMGTALAQAQLSTVADNIVNQPKQYQVEALLPMTYDSLIGNPFNTGGYTDPIIEAMEKYEDYTARGGEKQSITTEATQIITQAVPNAALDIIQLIVSLISLTVGAQLATNISWQEAVAEIMNGRSYNKDSFEAMWYSRGILKYKPPMEWKYRTVAITHYNLSKKPTEDGCYRLSLTLQELPILAVNYFNGEEEARANNKYVGWLGKGLSKILNNACTDIGN